MVKLAAEVAFQHEALELGTSDVILSVVFLLRVIFLLRLKH